MAVSASDPREHLSSPRSLDYSGTLFLTTGHVLYSNRSRPFFTITEDTAGRHDFLYAPCSQEMFEIQYAATTEHPNCLDNLCACFRAENLRRDDIPTPFNVFMHVEVDPATGALDIQPPSSAPGTLIELRAECDLTVAISACSAPNTNGGDLKPIAVEVRRG